MRFDINKILENRRTTAILSVLIAVLLWFGVSLGINNQDTKTFDNIPVRLDAANSTAGKFGLKPLIPEDEPRMVSVTISGNRSVLGNVVPEDIYVTAPINEITTAGEHTLTYAGSDINGKGFTVGPITPASEDIYFDNWVNRPFSVTFSYTGLVIPDEYIMDQEIIDPELIEINGPDSILSQIGECVVEYDFTEPLTETFNEKLPITFYDLQGERMEALDPAYVRINVQGGDVIDLPGEVQVILQILKRKTLPVVVNLTNGPDSFNPDTVGYTLSEDIITVAGPEDDIDALKEFPIGNVDMRDVKPGYTLPIKVSMRPNYSNVNEIETITVTFDLDGYDEKSLNVSNIAVVNAPEGYKVTVDSRQITGVTIMGPASVTRTLTAADLVAEIDMADVDDTNIVTGSRRMAVSVRVPDHDNVWVYGKYDVMVTVAAQ